MALAAGVPVVLAGLTGMRSSERSAERAVNVGRTVDVKQELTQLGYTVTGTRVDSSAARHLMGNLMREAAGLTDMQYIEDVKRDS